MTWNQPTIPLYGSIPATGKEYVITYKASFNENSIVTGYKSGYGDFPFDEFPGLPVIDYTSAKNDQLLKALKLGDNVRAKEQNPNYYKGSLETYLRALDQIGVTIVNYPF